MIKYEADKVIKELFDFKIRYQNNLEPIKGSERILVIQYFSSFIGL